MSKIDDPARRGDEGPPDDKQSMLDALRRVSEQNPNPELRAKQLRLLDILAAQQKSEGEES